MIKIISICYNTPHFIEYQYLLLKKFLQEEFEYIVYDNTRTRCRGGQIIILKEDDNNYNILCNICEKLDIKRIEVPKEIYGVWMPCSDINPNPGYYYPGWDVSTRAGRSITYACQSTIKNMNHGDYCFIQDTDMFLLKNFSLLDHMKDADIMGIPQNREHICYFTNQLFCFTLKNINKENIPFINFNPKNIDNKDIDCGADLYYLIKNQPKLKKEDFVNVLFSEKDKFLKDIINKDIIDYLNRDVEIVRKTHRQGGYHGEVYNHSFLHFRAGSNWRDGMKFSERTKNLFNLLNKYI